MQSTSVFINKNGAGSGTSYNGFGSIYLDSNNNATTINSCEIYSN